MGSLSKIRVDTEALSEGVWKTFAGCRWKIASILSKEYSHKLSKLVNENMALLQGDDKDDLSSELETRAAGECLLLDWEEVKLTDDSAPLVYSTEASIELLLNPEYIELYRFVQGVAGNMQSFRNSVLEAGKEP